MTSLNVYVLLISSKIMQIFIHYDNTIQKNVICKKDKELFNCINNLAILQFIARKLQLALNINTNDVEVLKFLL